MLNAKKKSQTPPTFSPLDTWPIKLLYAFLPPWFREGLFTDTCHHQPIITDRWKTQYVLRVIAFEWLDCKNSGRYWFEHIERNLADMQLCERHTGHDGGRQKTAIYSSCVKSNLSGSELIIHLQMPQFRLRLNISLDGRFVTMTKAKMWALAFKPSSCWSLATEESVSLKHLQPRWLQFILPWLI